jgi:hypothetical protein
VIDNVHSRCHDGLADRVIDNEIADGTVATSARLSAMPRPCTKVSMSYFKV